MKLRKTFVLWLIIVTVLPVVTYIIHIGLDAVGIRDGTNIWITSMTVPLILFLVIFIFHEEKMS